MCCSVLHAGPDAGGEHAWNAAAPSTVTCLHVLQVLRAIGLKSEIDTPIFLACACEVDSRGKQLQGADASTRSRTMEAAASLAAHFAENASMLHSPELYAGLAPLAVVPAVRVRVLAVPLPAIRAA